MRRLFFDAIRAHLTHRQKDSESSHWFRLLDCRRPAPSDSHTEELPAVGRDPEQETLEQPPLSASFFASVG